MASRRTEGDVKDAVAALDHHGVSRVIALNCAGYNERPIALMLQEGDGAYSLLRSDDGGAS